MKAIIGYAPGAFDLLHIGHLRLFQRARLHCDLLIAGVVSDDLVYARKGYPPIINEHDRMNLVSELKCVDLCVLEDRSKRDMWEELHFHKLFKGSDYAGQKTKELTIELEDTGATVILFPYTEGVSSSALRKVIANGR